eukprot:456186-Rhodomonas_salina.2
MCEPHTGRWSAQTRRLVGYHALREWRIVYARHVTQVPQRLSTMSVVPPSTTGVVPPSTTGVVPLADAFRELCSEGRTWAEGGEFVRDEEAEEHREDRERFLIAAQPVSVSDSASAHWGGSASPCSGRKR